MTYGPDDFGGEDYPSDPDQLAREIEAHRQFHMKTRRTNWSTHETFGGAPLISRGSGKAFAATDHCVALVKTCPRCLEKFMATPTAQDHGCPVLWTEAEIEAAKARGAERAKQYL